MVYYRLNRGFDSSYGKNFHKKNTITKSCIKAGKPVGFHYEDFSQELLIKTKYELSILLRDDF